jgi:hypothetical protein
VARLKWGDASVALTVKGVEVVVEIKNLARGVELWRWGADEQCLGIEGEVVTCSAAGERRGGGLAVERHDGCRSTALTGHRVNWGGAVRLGARPSGGGGGGASCLCGQVAEEEGVRSARFSHEWGSQSAAVRC